MEQFIHQNGYLTVFLTVAFAGEFGLLIGAALARTGAVSLTGVVILGTAASFVGNMIYYCVGKLVWNKWGFLRDWLGGKVQKSSKYVGRYGSPVMLVARFFYGIRDMVPLTLGLYQVRIGSFTLYNIIGAFVWALVFTLMGNAFSDFARRWFGGVQIAFFCCLAAVAVAVSLILLIRRALSRTRA